MLQHRPAVRLAGDGLQLLKERIVFPGDLFPGDPAVRHVLKVHGPLPFPEQNIPCPESDNRNIATHFPAF